MQKAVYILLLIISNCAFAQRIINFNLYPTGTLIGIKFTLTAGKDCGGYKILHSTDSLSFSVIEDYAGICGNISANEIRSYTHQTPALNQKNYYKVLLATSESSNIQSVYLASQNADAIKAYPNPLDANHPILSCRVAGSGNSKLKAIIYSQNGKNIRNLELFSKSDLVLVDVSGLSNGLYILEIANGEKPFTTKFLINR
ncbi:MAG: T9SS type A sorting domain-containing protein [Bacteroidia bacterium]|nr:T9SS type A sorting domain-containing protein [Bacteroidia bacterium]